MKLDDIRREYGDLPLDESDLKKHQNNPLSLFNQWQQEAIDLALMDATSFVLSTVDQTGQPDSRVLLLKTIKDGKFLFFTHYSSHKGVQIESSPKVSMNFYWRELSRQIRIKGVAEKASKKEAQQYFNSRPVESQISTIISKQSEMIENRAVLEKAFQELRAQYESNAVSLSCPQDWGGYLVDPFAIEFFQGRDLRLHDRILWTKSENQWYINRLSP